MTANIYVPLWLGIGVPWIILCLLPYHRFPRGGGTWRAGRTLLTAAVTAVRRFLTDPPQRPYDWQTDVWPRVTVYHRTGNKT
jgi:hypothetical protein